MGLDSTVRSFGVLRAYKKANTLSTSEKRRKRQKKMLPEVNESQGG